MKSRIKAFNPVIIGNRLVPKKEETPSYGSATQQSTTLVREPNILFKHQHIQSEPAQRPRYPAYEFKVIKKVDGSRRTPERQSNKNNESQTSSRQSEASSTDSPKLEERRSLTESSVTTCIKTVIKEGKQKLQQMDSHLSFYESLRLENTKILQKKFKQISEYKQLVQNLMLEKERQLNEIMLKNKKVEELTNEGRFKDIRIKELTSKMENLQRKRVSSFKGNQTPEDLLTKSGHLMIQNNSDWSKKYQSLIAEKDQVISGLQNQIRQLNSSHEKIQNQNKQELLSKLTDQESQYQKTIQQIQNTFASETSKLNEQFHKDREAQKNQHQKEIKLLQEFYDKKVKDLSKVHDERIQSLSNLSDENSHVIETMKTQHLAQVKLLTEQFSKEKDLLASRFQSDAGQEKQRHNSIVRSLAQKNRQILMENENLRIQLQEQFSKIQDLMTEMGKKDKACEQAANTLEMEKARYLRMENLWRDEKKTSDALKQSSKTNQSKLAEGNEKIKILTASLQKIQHTIRELEQERVRERQQQYSLKRKYQATLQQLQAAKVNSQKEVEDLNKVVSGWNERYSIACSQFEIFKKDEHQKFQTLLTQLTSFESKYQNQIAQKNKSVKRLQESHKEIQTQLLNTRRAYQVAINQHAEEKKNLARQISYKSSEILKLQGRLQYLDDLEKQFAKFKPTIQTLSKKAQGLLLYFNSTEQNLAPLKQTVDSLIEESISYESQFKSLQAKMQSSSQQMVHLLDEAHKQNQILNQKNQQLRKSIASMSHSHTQQINQLRLELNKRLQEEITKAQELSVSSQSSMKILEVKQLLDVASGHDFIEIADQSSQCEHILANSYGCSVLIVTPSKQEGAQTLIVSELVQFGCGSEYQPKADSACQVVAQLEEKGSGDCLLSELQDQETSYQLLTSQIGSQMELITLSLGIGTEQRINEQKQIQTFSELREFETQTEIQEDNKSQSSQKEQKSEDAESESSEGQSAHEDQNSAREENSENPSDQLREQEEQNQNPQNQDIGTLLEEIQEKQYVIEEMNQCIDDYKTMVWEMKQRMESQEGFQEKYLEILQIFSLDTENIDAATHEHLVSLINNFIFKINSLMVEIEKMENLTAENEALNNSKKRYLKDLKKFKMLIEAAEQSNQELDQKLAFEIMRNQKIEEDLKETELLLDSTNELLISLQAATLNTKFKGHLQGEIEDCYDDDQSPPTIVVNLVSDTDEQSSEDEGELEKKQDKIKQKSINEIGINEEHRLLDETNIRPTNESQVEEEANQQFDSRQQKQQEQSELIEKPEGECIKSMEKDEWQDIEKVKQSENTSDQQAFERKKSRVGSTPQRSRRFMSNRRRRGG